MSPHPPLAGPDEKRKLYRHLLASNMDKELKRRLLLLLKYEGFCLGALAVGTVIPIVNWIVWFPAVPIAVRIDPRPPVMLTTSIAVAEYVLLGMVLWLIKRRKTKLEMPN